MSQLPQENDLKKSQQNSKESKSSTPGDSSIDLAFEADTEKAMAESLKLSQVNSVDKKNAKQSKSIAESDFQVYEEELLHLYAQKAESKRSGYSASSSSSVSSSSSTSITSTSSISTIFSSGQDEGINPALLAKTTYEDAKAFLEQLKQLEKQPTVDIGTIKQNLQGQKFLSSSAAIQEAAKNFNLFNETVDEILITLHVKYCEIQKDQFDKSAAGIDEDNVISRIQMYEATKEKLNLLSEYAKRSPSDKNQIAAQCLEAINQLSQKIDGHLKSIKESFPVNTKAFYASLNEKKLSGSAFSPPISVIATPKLPEEVDSDNDENSELEEAKKLSERLLANKENLSSEQSPDLSGAATSEDSDDENAKLEEAKELSKQLAEKAGSEVTSDAETDDEDLEAALLLSRGVQLFSERNSARFFSPAGSPRSTPAPTDTASITAQATDQNKTDSSLKFGMGGAKF